VVDQPLQFSFVGHWNWKKYAALTTANGSPKSPITIMVRHPSKKLAACHHRAAGE